MNSKSYSFWALIAAGAIGVAGALGNVFIACFGRVEFIPPSSVIGILLSLTAIAILVCLDAAFDHEAIRISLAARRFWGSLAILGAIGAVSNTVLALLNWLNYAQPLWTVWTLFGFGIVTFWVCLRSGILHFYVSPTR